MNSIRVLLILSLLGFIVLSPMTLTFAKDIQSMSHGKFNVINTDKAPAAIGAYSQGIEIDDTYYFSGQIGIDPETMALRAAFGEQLDQILKNIDALLESCNLARANIVKSTIFLTDLDNFSAVNEAYTSFFNGKFPARSCVEASNLPKGALVEIEVIAHK